MAKRNPPRGDFEAEGIAAQETRRAEETGYKLPRGEGGDAERRGERRRQLHMKRDRQQLAANIVVAVIEALDRPQLFTSEQLLLLDQLYDGASGLESLV